MNIKNNPVYKYLLKIPVKKAICLLRRVKSGANTFISFGASVIKPGKVTLGSNVVIEKYARLECIGDSSALSIGDQTFVRPYAYIKADHGKVSIGRKCTINDFCVLNGVGDVNIGDDVHIAAHVVIVSMNHNYADPRKNIGEQGISKIGINIEDDIWIGASAVILDGVTIGKGSVIGAGSVVTKSIPPYSVAVGVPCKVVKSRKNS